MPLELSPERAVLSGHADIHEVEPLHDWMRDHPAPLVDVASCSSMHMAMLQMLIVLAPQIEGDEGRGDWRMLLRSPHRFQPNSEE